jgi:hypothetical protein
VSTRKLLGAWQRRARSGRLTTGAAVLAACRRLNLGDLGMSLESYESFEIDSIDAHLPAPVSSPGRLPPLRVFARRMPECSSSSPPLSVAPSLQVANCSAAASPSEEVRSPARPLDLNLDHVAIVGAWGGRRPFTLHRATLAALATSITLPSPSALPDSIFAELCAAELAYGTRGSEATSSAPAQRQRVPSSSGGSRPSGSGVKRARLGTKPADTRPVGSVLSMRSLRLPAHHDGLGEACSAPVCGCFGTAFLTLAPCSWCCSASGGAS